MHSALRAILRLAPIVLVGCTEPAARTVAGSMKFRVGATAPVTPAPPVSPAPGPSLAVVAGDEFIVSPRQAKITFRSVNFKDAAGVSLANSDLTNCTVVYDRSLSSGAALLDCAFTVPVGEVAEMQLFYDKTVELLVSDPTVGVYSNPAAASRFSTTSPAGGAAYVPYTITIGDGTTRAAGVVFSTPVVVAEGDSPSIYVTLDMIHTIQLKVNGDGTTLTPNVTTDPVAVFAGLSPGTSRYYSAAPGIDGYRVQGVASLRAFVDNTGQPLFVMIGPNFCGPDGGPKAAWASPPVAGMKRGGWLGRDANNTIAWAMSASDTWTSYTAYYVMAEQAVIGQPTVLHCKVTTSPPPPADGKTYASGAPALSAPDKSVTLRLIAK